MRSICIIVVCVLIGILLNTLSNVLIPFFVAWLLAYMMYPLVSFFEKKLHLRYRIPCIVLSMILVLAFIAGILALVLPSTISETHRAVQLATAHMNETFVENGLLSDAINSVKQELQGESIKELMRQDSFSDTIESLFAFGWDIVSRAIDLVMGVLTFFLIVLYTFFILLDYERISEGWIHLIPPSKRKMAEEIVGDVKHGMSSYFRGQSLIAFCVGVLFSIGFLIIDLPMAIGLGMFIGLLNMVPYLQIVGIAPTVVLAWLKSADTGQSFWGIMFAAFTVFVVVQTIQDVYLTPRIMSKVMGLKPAIILLSLSVWGSLLGFLGFIIALPLTTLIISYYKRFVIKEEQRQTDS